MTSFHSEGPELCRTVRRLKPEQTRPAFLLSRGNKKELAFRSILYILVV